MHNVCRTKIEPKLFKILKLFGCRHESRHEVNASSTIRAPVSALLSLNFEPGCRERQLNTNFFFSQIFRALWRDAPAKSRDIPPKKFDSLVSRGIPNFLAPTPSCGRPPPHRKISRLKSLGLGSFFVAMHNVCPNHSGIASNNTYIFVRTCILSVSRWAPFVSLTTPN